MYYLNYYVRGNKYNPELTYSILTGKAWDKTFDETVLLDDNRYYFCSNKGDILSISRDDTTAVELLQKTHKRVITGWDDEEYGELLQMFSDNDIRLAFATLSNDALDTVCYVAPKGWFKITTAYPLEKVAIPEEKRAEILSKIREMYNGLYPENQIQPIKPIYEGFQKLDYKGKRGDSVYVLEKYTEPIKGKPKTSFIAVRRATVVDASIEYPKMENCLYTYITDNKGVQKTTVDVYTDLEEAYKKALNFKKKDKEITGVYIFPTTFFFLNYIYGTISKKDMNKLTESFKDRKMVFTTCEKDTVLTKDSNRFISTEIDKEVIYDAYPVDGLILTGRTKARQNFQATIDMVFILRMQDWHAASDRTYLHAWHRNKEVWSHTNTEGEFIKIDNYTDGCIRKTLNIIKENIDSIV